MKRLIFGSAVFSCKYGFCGIITGASSSDCIQRGPSALDMLLAHSLALPSGHSKLGHDKLEHENELLQTSPVESELPCL